MDEERKNFASRYYGGNRKKYKENFNDRTVESNHSESTDFYSNANLQYINKMKKQRNKYEHDVPFERTYGGDLKRNVSRYSRYDKSSYVKSPNITEADNPKITSPMRGNIQISKGDIVNYHDQFTDDRLVNQRNMKPLPDIGTYSDERHGARRKNFCSRKDGHYNRSNIMEDNFDDYEYKSGNSYASGVFKIAKGEMPTGIEKMAPTKDYHSTPERYFGLSQKDIPFREKSYYNRALSIEDENNHVSNNLQVKKQDLAFKTTSYHNTVMSTVDENMHISQANYQESYSYDRKFKSPTSNEKKFYIKDQTPTGHHREQFNEYGNVNVLKHVSEKNSGLYHADKESFSKAAKHEARYHSSKFEDSHLSHGNHFIKSDYIASVKQDRESEMCERHSRNYKGTESNQRIGIQSIELESMNQPAESFNAASTHDARYNTGRFKHSHLSHRKRFLESEDFASVKQVRESEMYKRHSRAYKGTESNQTTGIQSIELKSMNQPLPEESLNMHDAFVIGKVMMGEESKESIDSDPQLLIISENEEGIRVSERQCWSKSCFSLFKHSHVFDKHSSKKNALENR